MEGRGEFWQNSPAMPQPADPPVETSPKQNAPLPQPAPREIGGPAGPEPTRYGDWERNGRCVDF